MVECGVAGGGGGRRKFEMTRYSWPPGLYSFLTYSVVSSHNGLNPKKRSLILVVK